jgi:hypothetical protein
MPLKCCVYGCTSNYLSGKDKSGPVPVYRLPKNETEKNRWLATLPRDNTPVTKYTVVCAKHWPSDYRKMKSYGKERPASPPSCFGNLPQSLVPSAPPKPRETSRTSAEVRSAVSDELSSFCALDSITTTDEVLTSDQLDKTGLIVYKSDRISIQSTEFIHGIPK